MFISGLHPRKCPWLRAFFGGCAFLIPPQCAWAPWQLVGRAMLVCCRYLDATLLLDPGKFGAPLGRKRLYIILVRQDVLAPGVTDLGAALLTTCLDMKADVSLKWCLACGKCRANLDTSLRSDLLLPNDHFRVSYDINHRNQLRMRNSFKQLGPHCKPS